MITDVQIMAAMKVLIWYENPCGATAIRAALEAAEKAAWRPISEAPKDATILVSVEATALNKTFYGRPRETHPAYVDEHGRMCNTGTWLPDSGISGEFWNATHFRPLPKGPSDE